MAQANPVAMAVPTSAPMSMQAGMAPRHRNSNQDTWKSMGLRGKVGCVVVVLLALGAGMFFFVRMAIQNCGCPEEGAGRLLEGRLLQHSDSTCFCEGNVFSCKWECGGTCYSGGEASDCETGEPLYDDYDDYDNNSNSTAYTDGDPSDGQQCPGEDDYCDCSASACDSNACSCVEHGDPCCGR
jgi:hypothetical protein